MKELFENTTSATIAKRLAELTEESALPATGKVLNMIAVVSSHAEVSEAIDLCAAASAEHPCRVLVVVSTEHDVCSGLRAELHYGPEMGASDVIVLDAASCAPDSLDTLVIPLLAADTPVVTFWPFSAPAAPALHPLGRIASRRITDSRQSATPFEFLRQLAGAYKPGDTDLSWGAVTLWRGLLAAMVDEAQTAQFDTVRVVGNPAHPAPYLLAKWLQLKLGVEIEFIEAPVKTLESVALLNGAKVYEIYREDESSVAVLRRPGLVDTKVNLPRRQLHDSLMEDLRLLDEDQLYSEVLALCL
ncbi:putative opcA protein [Gleimia coleocanis DSM 15436]|uniref:Putative opcA protein n=1 Tax=Gleimia coleocanis DSM 15436 TaxID=525245 RepID=C0W1H1_9ACTO|nr:glucose-6-phosphate dehydrogenase assembly protein OpcA [Gleimia coleocanis]EEH63337.1 putative opcA protein [Gleimia coleocanis DSM 15436]